MSSAVAVAGFAAGVPDPSPFVAAPSVGPGAVFFWATGARTTEARDAVAALDSVDRAARSGCARAVFATACRVGALFAAVLTVAVLATVLFEDAFFGAAFFGAALLAADFVAAIFFAAAFPTAVFFTAAFLPGVVPVGRAFFAPAARTGEVALRSAPDDRPPFIVGFAAARVEPVPRPVDRAADAS